MPEAPFVPVVPAGGSGTRLWPLSRRARPKFLLDLTGSRDNAGRRKLVDAAYVLLSLLFYVAILLRSR